VPALLTFDDYIGALTEAGRRLVAVGSEAGLDARVPPCPAWDVRALVAHQAMVHRWATAHVSGGDPSAVPQQTALRERPDLLDYYREGLDRLVAALRSAPPDLEALRFLRDAPPARLFWARRQAHETTIHGADAEAARLGRLPSAADVPISPALAEDGIDELLRGFFTRGRSKLAEDPPTTLLIDPDDVERRWLVRIGPDFSVDPDGAEQPEGGADVTMTGASVDIYLALWNRGDHVACSDDGRLLARWRTAQRVRWS
jgi:uncharacterized protein (TIGR03083 family)